MNFNITGTFALNVASEPPAPIEGKVFVAVMTDGITVTAEADTMDTNIPEGKRIKIEVLPQDVSGNPAPIDGNVTWTSTDPTMIQVVPDTASTSQAQAWIQNAAGGTLGTTTVTYSADADQGSGVTTITGSLTFNAVAGQAAAFGVEEIGALEDIPPGP